MPHAYRRLLLAASRCAPTPGDAEELVQEALLEAVRAERADLRDQANVRWLVGVVRNKGLQLARSRARASARDSRWAQEAGASPPAATTATQLTDEVAKLPRGLRIVALLALSGHDRREISYLLDIPDTALRQRIHALRRRLGGAGVPDGLPGLGSDLAYGRIRQALRPPLHRHSGVFASHDPDGHLFVVRRSQNT